MFPASNHQVSETMRVTTQIGGLEMRRQTLSLLFVFSFVYLSGMMVSSAQSINIFGNLVPIDPTQADNAPITLGVKFWSSEPGSISGIRFNRPVASPSGYVAQLYSAGGTLLGSVTMARESSPVPGWQVATFAAPISISPNTTYVAAYYLPSSTYQRDYDELDPGRTTGPLTAPAGSAVGGNGVFNFGNAFPSSTWGNTNFFVDVAFSPATPSSNPTTPSSTSSSQQLSIFGNLVPVDPTQADNAPITLGVKFWSSEPGSISGIRFNRPVASPSGYVAQLYSAGGTLLGSVTMARESSPVPGWQVATFAAPISISPNTTYVAAYYLPSSTYQRDYDELDPGRTTGPLTAPAGSAVGGNGVFNFGNAFPSSTWGNTNFFVDVAFSPATPSSNPTTPSSTSSSQQLSIFGNLVPVDPTQADNAPITLGVKFWSSEPGAISGIRFCRPTASPSGYV